MVCPVYPCRCARRVDAMSVKITPSSDSPLSAVPHSHSFELSHHKIRDGATWFFVRRYIFVRVGNPHFIGISSIFGCDDTPCSRVRANEFLSLHGIYWVFENSDAALRKAIEGDLASLLDHALAPERVQLSAHEHSQRRDLLHPSIGTFPRRPLANGYRQLAHGHPFPAVSEESK